MPRNASSAPWSQTPSPRRSISFACARGGAGGVLGADNHTTAWRVFTQLIRMDTADAFRISANNVFVRNIDFVLEQQAELLPASLGTVMGYAAPWNVSGVGVNTTLRRLPPPAPLPLLPPAGTHGSRRMILDANVTAMIEVVVSLNASQTDIAAAIAVRAAALDRSPPASLPLSLPLSLSLPLPLSLPLSLSPSLSISGFSTALALTGRAFNGV
jgi:hypothetical protein